MDIGGSFYGSTADSILFEDGEFSATDLENPPLLTINAPIGLNFRDNPGEIVNRSIVQNSTGTEFVGLEVLPGMNLTLVGGNINFERGLDDSRIINQVASGGVGNSGNITIVTGSIEATNGGELDASTFGQGNRHLRNSNVLW